MPFIDRNDAGRQLAKALASYKFQKPVVLALPRGGVPVAAQIATPLVAPLDLILVRKGCRFSQSLPWAPWSMAQRLSRGKFLKGGARQ